MGSTILQATTVVILIGQTTALLVFGERASMVRVTTAPVGGFLMVLDWVMVVTATIIPTTTGGITTGATATIITTVQRSVVTIQLVMKLDV